MTEPVTYAERRAAGTFEAAAAARAAELQAAAAAAPAPAAAPADRDHVPIGGDVELQQAIGEGGGSGGTTTLAGLTDVTGDPGPGKSPVGEATGTDFPLTRVTTEEDLDAILAAVAQVDWRPLPLENGFVDVGGEYAPCRYRLTLNNVVHIEGLVRRDQPLSTSDAGLTISTLAADSLPGERLIFLAACDDRSVARVDVQQDGRISFEGFLGVAGAAPIPFADNNAIASLEGSGTLIAGKPTWEVELTSFADSYGAAEWLTPAVLTPATMSALEVEYQLVASGAGGGSPRLVLGIDGRAVQCLLGTPPNFDDPESADYQASGNLADSANPDARFDLSQYGGPQVATWADVLAQLGDQRITTVYGVDDGGWKFPGPKGQVVRFRNLRVTPVDVPPNYLSLSGISYSFGGPSPVVAAALEARR